MFANNLVKHADRPALVCAGRHLTYRELDHAATGIADCLHRNGVGKGELVALASHRSIEAIAAILGILKIGGAYLPFDISYPPKLLRYLHDDSAPRMTIVQRAPGESPAIARFWDGKVVYIGADFGLSGDLTSPQPSMEENPRQMTVGIELPAGPEDLAYVMYTSGSTGNPKGVMIPHRGVTRLVSDCEFVDLGPGETILHLAPLSFDASTFEIWGALLNGGRLVVMPAAHPSLDEIAEAIRAHRVTTLWLTAGLFNVMVERRLDGLKPLRQLVVGGDALSPPHIERALAALPSCRIVNGYGPTENTTFTCCYTIPRDGVRRGSIPIGSAIRGTTVHVLDAAMRLVADGEEGELYAGGAGVAHGYLNRPELTAEKFVADPFAPAPGARLYRTGDRVRRQPDGNLEFLGRIDRQVKINGKRVELDGIEACLRRAPAVRDAAVVSHVEDGGRRLILAFVTPADGHMPAPAEMRAFLRSRLPDFMVPAEITVIDALPLSPTGKVDRARLSRFRAAEAAAVASRRLLPADGTQDVLKRIWIGILGLAAIEADDNFFDLGGTSLQLLEVHAEIASAFAVPISVVDLFDRPNIRELAARIDGKEVVKPSLFAADDRARQRHKALARARPAVGQKGAA